MIDDTPTPRPEAAEPAKRLGRRATLKLLGLAVTAATVGSADAATPAQSRGAATPTRAAGRRGRAWSLRPLATGTQPRTFAGAEFTALAAVVNLLLPDTDTPGARTAGVHWYLDDAGAHDAALATRLREGLRRLNARAQSRHRRAFAEISEAQQIAMLSSYDHSEGGTVALDSAAQPRVTGAAPAIDAITPDDRGFFALVKAQTIDGYYKSEMGQIGELEWVGHEFNDTFPGVCSHIDPGVHPRPRWPRARA